MSVSIPLPGPVARRPIVIGFWLTFAVLYTLQSYSVRMAAGQRIELWPFLGTELLYVAYWLLFTPLILRASRRFRIEPGRVRAGVARHVVFGVLIGALHRAIYDGTMLAIRATPELPFSITRLGRMVLNYFDYGVFLYLLVVFIDHAVEYHERYAREEVRAARLRSDLHVAELAALRARLEPHFLFNTLNSIAVLIEEDPRRARTMLDELSALLRLVLTAPRAEEVSLRAEIEFLERYVSIERTRFGDRLSVRMAIEPETLDARVPYMILQPLVENAVRHGVGSLPGAGRIEIRAAADGGQLRLEVCDTGLGAETRSEEGTGVGLANVRSRLRTLYGADGVVEIGKGGEFGWIVRVSLPLNRNAIEPA